MSVGINGVGYYGYNPQIVEYREKPYTPKDFKPGLITPKKEEKKSSGVAKFLITATILTGAALFLKKTTKGQDILKWVEGLWNKVKSAPTPKTEAPKATASKATAPKANASNKNVTIDNLNANDRKLVQDAMKDVPTKEQQIAYNEEIKYVAPTQSEKIAIAENNSKAHQAKREAQSIGNLISDDSKKALENLKTELPVNPKATAPKAETPVTVKPEVKKAQMEQAWAEYTQTPVATPEAKVNIPTTEQIFAKAEAEAAKVAQEEAEALKAMGF